jgi:hypothetical protein
MIARKAGPGALAILLICFGCTSTPNESQGPPVPQLTNSPDNPPVSASLPARPMNESTMGLTVLGNPTPAPTPSPGNAFAELADNKFEMWTGSFRIYMPAAQNAPPTTDR